MTTPELGPDAFREASARLAAGVVVVTTQADGFDHAMTATSFTPVSLDPPLALVCVEQDTRFCDSISDGVLTTGLTEPTHDKTWAVSLLAASERPAAAWFATKGRPLHGQFGRHRHHRGKQTGNIILDSALASFELRTVFQQQAGDHLVVVGRVVGLELADIGAASGSSEPESGAGPAQPLVYWWRQYRQLEVP